MRLCKAEMVRKETELMMKPYANWEEFLMPGPLSIAILGELACISAGQGDFSINKNSPPDGFKYIRYPESFLTCLMQVSHKGWDAFNAAHKNMDQIRLLSMSVPRHMKAIVQTLFQDLDVVDALLPPQLTNMKSIADECSQLARSVEHKFSDVIYLIQELLEACMSSKKGYEDDLKEIERTLEDAWLREQSVKQAKEMAEEYYQKMKGQVDKTYKDYSDAMSSLPLGWNALAFGVMESLINVINTVPNAVSRLFLSTRKKDSSPETSTENKEDDPIAVNNILSKSELLLNLATQICSLSDDKNSSRAPDQKQLMFNFIEQRAQSLHDQINAEKSCQIKTPALQICTSTLHACSVLKNSAKSADKNSSNSKKVKKALSCLHNKARAFDSQSKLQSKTTPLPPKAPNMAKWQQSMAEGHQVESQAAQNARFKIEQSREMLKMTQKEYQRSFENFKKQNEELADILSTMRKCETKEIDFQRARDMLIKGLEALGRVKEQWEKMVHFFQMISSLIESCLSRSIKGFVSSAESVQKIENYSSMSFVTDLIYTQAFNATSVSHLVHMISETYTEVSSKYLMDRVSSLGRLISMDPSDPAFQSERLKLAHACDEAREEIYKLVIKKKEEFENDLKTRTETIACELNSALPPVTREEERAIQDTVQQSFRELTLEEEDQYA
ncbi:hypothetical protein Y1Q_0022124 [Alligator mississippiensis]|uniref:Uncharacterized protein n=1 Tax=Alligator mississippiensis TaxID=8496 RepID=A0A151MG44_ALLMI|nr:hypothetical protein Y1Q_0022124 [Alligator mississippiensis]